MFDNKKILTLAEDFKALGLIREENKNNVEKKDNLQENQRKVINNKNVNISKKRLEEQQLRNKKIKLFRAKKLALLKAKKIAESKKVAKPKVENTKTALENLQDIEKRLKTNLPFEEMIKAFQNVVSVSHLASKKFTKLAEQDDVTYDGDKQDSTGKEAGKTKLDINDKEGNVGFSADDEQNNDVETGEVDTVTDKYAGQPAHIDPDTQQVKIAEQDDELNLGQDDELDLEQDDLMLDEPGMDELDLDAEPSDDIDLAMSDMGPELEPDMDIEPELDMGPEIDLDTDSEMGNELEPELDMEPELDVEPELDMEPEIDLDTDLEVDNEIEMDDEEEEELPLENKRIRKSTYIAELKNIRKEAEDILQKIKKHAISPQDAEGILKDIVMRLGGAVGDLADMSQFSGSDKESAV